MFEERITSIQRKLRWLKLCWPNKTLCPQATQDQMQALRDEYGVILPADYQAFIENVGDGIYDHNDIECSDLESLFCENHPLSLHRQYSNLDKDERTPLCYGFIPFPIQWRIRDFGCDETIFDPLRWAELNFYERAESHLALIINWLPDWTFRVLILTGENEGFVWHFDAGTGASKPFQSEETGTCLSFLGWFEAQLDHNLFHSGTHTDL